MQIWGKGVLSKGDSKYMGHRVRKRLRVRGPVWLEQSEQRENDRKFGQRVDNVRHGG